MKVSNLGCCKCVILKQQNRNSAKFGDHQISQFPIFHGGSIILGDLKVWFQDKVWEGLGKAAPARTAIGELSY